jgi:oxygen-independent coproporphyrinogen-3 oxidase
MKLTLIGHDYQYAVEQMLLTLFPGERPVYQGEEENRLTLSLSRGGRYLTASARLEYQGRLQRAACRAPLTQLSGDKIADDRVCQRILKMAFFQAATRLLGSAPPWGALTGVRPVKLPTRAMEGGATPRQAAAMLQRVYRVTPARSALAVDCAQASLAAKASLAPEDVSLYVGIPFCPTRCAYCSFISADVGRSLQLVEPYLQALFQEIQAAGEVLRRAGRQVKSVYIGGGTPTTLSAGQLADLMGQLARSIDLTHCVEYTVEAGRPDTITAEKMAAIRQGGGDRVSVNPQSMHDHVLAAMGRAHRAEDIFSAYRLVRQAGIPAVNMDLIAGLPQDTPEGFRTSLDSVLDLDPENVTVHTLALKKGSRLMQEESRLPGGEAVAQMLDYAWAALRQAGYRPYYLYRQKFMSGSFENVGWCKPGFESLYNICMMEELHTVLSLGAGGVTKVIDPRAGSLVRIANPKYPKEYIDQIETAVKAKEGILWPTN